MTTAPVGIPATQLNTRLKLAREWSGLSQGQVANKLSLHRPSISEIEAGRRRVSVEELVRFAELYRVDIDWLAGVESLDPNPRVELAARELSKLKSNDLERLLVLIRALVSEGAP